MLLAIEITVNIFYIPLACVACLIIGFLIRKAPVSGLKSKIRNLESEILQNHAEILSLQKENALLMNNIKDNSVPVIPITAKENTEATVDANMRKKLLVKPATTQV